MLAGLQDPAIVAKKREAETVLRDAVSKDPKLKQAYGDAWEDVSATLKTLISNQQSPFGVAIDPAASWRRTRSSRRSRRDGANGFSR